MLNLTLTAVVAFGNFRILLLPTAGPLQHRSARSHSHTMPPESKVRCSVVSHNGVVARVFVWLKVCILGQAAQAFMPWT